MVCCCLAFLEIGVISATLRISRISPSFKHRLKVFIIKIVLSLTKLFYYLSGNIARKWFFINVKIFISLITSVLKISLTENVLFLSKQLRIVTILGWFSNLVIIDSKVVSEEKRGRRFSLIPRFLTILTKNSLNVLANSPSSWIIFVPSTKVMLFLDFNLQPKICFTVF